MPDYNTVTFIDSFLKSDTPQEARTFIETPSVSELYGMDIINYDDSVKTLSLSDQSSYLRYAGDVGGVLNVPPIDVDFDWGIGYSVAIRNSSTENLSIIAPVLGVNILCNDGDEVVSPNAVVQLIHVSTNNWDLI